LFEIFTRFSVPIFFFISAFGLFYNLSDEKKFDYLDFLKRRGRAVLVPYVVWSLFYLALGKFVYGAAFPDAGGLFYTLFFGLAKYQLYFLVILLWFYLLMPLWIFLLRRMDTKLLSFLFLIQIAFNYFSSYSSELFLYVIGLPEGSFWRSLLEYRLNYFVGHYFFIFLLGGYLARRIDDFKSWIKNNRGFVFAAYFLSLIFMLSYYYHVLSVGYTPTEAIFTVHQLCPLGVIYTVTASVFWFTLFSFPVYSPKINPLLAFLGKHSYFAYLAHPFFIGYGAEFLANAGKIMTAPVAVSFYLSVLTLSLLAALIFRRLGNLFPPINILTIGVYPKISANKK